MSEDTLIGKILQVKVITCTEPAMRHRKQVGVAEEEKDRACGIVVYNKKRIFGLYPHS